MPHFHIDYSPNVEVLLNVPAFCETIRKSAIETGIFPVAGIRIRAIRADYFVMADGQPDHAYLDLSIRLRAGRDPDTKRAATNHIFEAAQTFCADALANASFMLSMEMRDIDPELSPKVSSIRRYLPDEN